MRTANGFAKNLIEAFSIKNNLRSLFCRPNDNFATVDGIRALSILWVIFFHIYFLVSMYVGAEGIASLLRETPFYMYWVWNADKAVDAFFALSGFLISYYLFKEYQQTKSLNLKRFYIRRFMRLTPVYWFALLICFLLTDRNSDMLWANVFYVNNFIPVDRMAMEWTWSLAVEEQFYLVFPLFLLMIFFKSNRPVRWLCFLLILSLVVRFVVAYSYDSIWYGKLTNLLNPAKDMDDYVNGLYVNLYTRFGPLACGVFVSYLMFYKREYTERLVVSRLGGFVTVLSCVFLIGLAGIPLIHPDIEWPRFFELFYIISNRLIFGLAISWLMMASFFPSGFGAVISKILSLKLWFPIAQLSYSMYLFHIMVVLFVLFNLNVNMVARGMDMSDITFWGVFSLSLIIIPVSIVLSVFTFIFIERPFMNMRGKHHIPSKAESSLSANGVRGVVSGV